MIASGTNNDRVAQSGSLLSLAPREPVKLRKLTANPVLAALARLPDAAAGDAPSGTPNDPPAAEDESAVEQAVAEETSKAAVIEETRSEEDVPAAEPVANEVLAEETAPGESIAAPVLEEQLPEPPVTESVFEKPTRDDSPGPETANGLVARLRRQFTEGLPEGRDGATGAEATNAEPKQDGSTPRRSPIEELRSRLGEFRNEILARAPGRGKTSS